MKFIRRPDLDPQTRIHIVMLAWLHQGLYGKMTEIATLLSDIQDLSLPTTFDGNPAIGNAV